MDRVKKMTLKPKMSNRRIQLEINCGDFTCASEPGKFCKCLGTSKFGQLSKCNLFDGNLEEEEGWLQRCQECLDSEVKDVK